MGGGHWAQLLLQLLRRLTLQLVLLHDVHCSGLGCRCLSHLALKRPWMRLLPLPLQAPSRLAVAQGRLQPPQDVLRSRWLWLLLKRQQRQRPLLLDIVRMRPAQHRDSALALASLSTCLMVSGLPMQAVWERASRKAQAKASC